MLLVTLLLGCAGKGETPTPPDDTADTAPDSGEGGETGEAGDSGDTGEALLADVIAVEATGGDGDWTFSVTVSSPDAGCELYADWWEVLDPAGALIFRRTLDHSHTDEQPFTRTGGPVEIGSEDGVLVRAHMAPGGYGGAALVGSVADGFLQATGDEAGAGYASDLETSAPQPEPCRF